MDMKKLVLVLLIGGVLQAAFTQDAPSPETDCAVSALIP
jgi:hypothetical protein